MFSFLLTDYFIVIVHLFIFYFFVSFLLIMTFDLKAQPASISSAICGLHRIIIVFSSLTNKMEMEMEIQQLNNNARLLSFSYKC